MSAMDDFHAGVKKDVPEGHTFKGFPIHFTHTHTKRIVAACMRDKICNDIIECVGDHVRFALRIRIFAYAEDAFSVWCMLAVKFRSVK